MGVNKSEDGTGPQGTQAFNVDDVNKMIAEEIINSQSSEASTPVLIGLSTGITGKCFVFDDNEFSIGRNADNFIVLTQPSVSSTHAKIRKVDAGWKIMNLLSSNGTFVNGKKVTEKVIVPGDRIAFAEAEFVYGLVDQKEDAEKPNRNNRLIYITIIFIAAIIAALLYLF